MRKRFLASLFCLPASLALAALPLHAQQRTPIQADLLHSLDSGRVSVGDAVFAKVVAKWHGDHCDLREGAILKGRVVAQTSHSRQNNTSQLAVLFDSGQCDGRDLKPLPLTIAAVLALDPRQDASLYENESLADAVGVSVGGRSGGPSGAGLPGGTGGFLRSVSSAAAVSEVSPQHYSGPTSIRPGQIEGIKGAKLNVGGGPEGSSIISISGRNIRLESGAQFVLVPNLVATPAPPPPPAASPAAPPHATAPAASPTAVPLAAKPAEPPPPDDETEICTPPQCSLALTPFESETKAAAAWQTLPLQSLGYGPPRPDHAMYAFDFGPAISYLGPKEMLFTFDPHIMVRRTPEESALANLRTIRAVLIDVQSQKVLKSVDWKVPDARQYQWPIGRDTVLVHVGRELRLYGPGLKLQRSFALGGPLAFVRISPSCTYFAVGVIQERHSPAIHRQLEEAEGRDPEEDVEIKVLDRNFHLLATVTRSSRTPPPVLSDNGEIQLLSSAKNRWQILEVAWDQQKIALAQVNSTCRPDATTLPSNLIFLVGCDRTGSGKWYRVLRSDGKPVLKGWSSSIELQQIARGDVNGAAFAVGMAEAAKNIAADSVFQTSDLAGERVAVYRAADGKRMLAVTVPAPVPAMQTFVLSPDGAQLAVLLGDQIAFYKVPPASSAH